MDLSKKHFTEWPENIRKEFYNKVAKIAKKEKIPFVDILVSGSRVMLPELKVFKETSDIDTLLLLEPEEYDKRFYVNETLNKSEVYLQRLKDEYPHLRDNRIGSFLFHNIRVSIFTRKKKGQPHKNYYLKYILGYYSFKEDRFETGCLVDVLDYYTHLKTRIDKHDICFLCMKKPAPYLLTFRMYSLESKFDDKVLSERHIYVCEDCKQKIEKQQFLINYGGEQCTR